jgi:hypothetical protein
VLMISMLFWVVLIPGVVLFTGICRRHVKTDQGAAQRADSWSNFACR